jgi:hypothetical protein
MLMNFLGKPKDYIGYQYVPVIDQDRIIDNGNGLIMVDDG